MIQPDRSETDAKARMLNDSPALGTSSFGQSKLETIKRSVFTRYAHITSPVATGLAHLQPTSPLLKSPQNRPPFPVRNFRFKILLHPFADLAVTPTGDLRTQDISVRRENAHNYKQHKPHGADGSFSRAGESICLPVY